MGIIFRYYETTVFELLSEIFFSPNGQKRTNTSVFKNLAENCIFSPSRQIDLGQTNEKPINQKCAEIFFNLFNILYAID